MNSNQPSSQPTAIPTTSACACGCGEMPSLRGSTFAQGHDAKLRGILQRAARGEASPPASLPAKARAWLRGRAWMTSQMAAMVAFIPTSQA